MHQRPLAEGQAAMHPQALTTCHAMVLPCSAHDLQGSLNITALCEEEQQGLGGLEQVG